MAPEILNVSLYQSCLVFTDRFYNRQALYFCVCTICSYSCHLVSYTRVLGKVAFKTGLFP